MVKTKTKAPFLFWTLSPMAAFITLSVMAACATPPHKFIAALDQFIQARFAKMDMERFGLRRLGPQHTLQVQLKTVEEMKAVADIKDAGWDAVLFLAGRAGRPSGVSPVSRALAITGDAPRKDLPQESQLREQAEKALAAFGTRNSYDFQMGQWFVAARPVRASRHECLSCHNRPSEKTPLRVGDPLGVVMYAFTRKH